MEDWLEGSEEKQKTISNVDDAITLLHLWGCNGITTASAVMIGKEIFIGGYKGPKSFLLELVLYVLLRFSCLTEFV